MALALPFFLAIGFWDAKKTTVKMTRRDWSAVLALGFVGYYLSAVMNFAGLQYISVGLERMVLYTYPSLVVIGGVLFFKRRVAPRTIAAIAIAYFGVVIAFWGEGKLTGTPAHTATGLLLVFGSAVTYSAFVLTSGGVIKRIGSTRFTSCVVGTSCVLVLCHFAIAHPVLDLVRVSNPVLAYGGVLAIFGTVLPSFLLGIGLKRTTAENFATIGTIGPLMTLVLAWALLGETLNAAQAIGFALTLSGGLLVSVRRK